VLLNKPAKTTKSKRASFGWGAKRNGEYQSSFKSQCKLDKQVWKSCSPGKTYTGLKVASHTFRVRVAPKNTTRWDATPAVWTWRIKR
jgi:hypothetical protein